MSEAAKSEGEEKRRQSRRRLEIANDYTSSHYINEIEDPVTLERLRGEILSLVAHRSREYDASLGRLISFLGAVCSGSVVAIIALIAQRAKGPLPIAGLGSIAAFTGSFAVFSFALYRHFHLHSLRYNALSDIADGFFQGRNTLEDILSINRAPELESASVYRLLFWVPCALVIVGVAFATLFILNIGPRV